MRSRILQQPAARGTMIVLLLLIIVLAPGGCVRRRLMITSNPPGGMAYVDNQPLGLTPVSTSFLYYGTREFRIEKAGFETAVVKRTIDPPWYQIPPIDFVSENFWPGELRDERVVHFDLQPQRIVPPQEVRQRGEDLRLSVRQGHLTALPGANFQGPLPGPPPAQPTYRPPGAPSIESVPAFGRPLDPPPNDAGYAAPNGAAMFSAPPYGGPQSGPAESPIGAEFDSRFVAPWQTLPAGERGAPPLLPQYPAF